MDGTSAGSSATGAVAGLSQAASDARHKRHTVTFLAGCLDILYAGSPVRDDRLMALTLADFLALPPLQAARPEVVAGTRLDERPVRWVHTSEIYGISPLLKGGEVLMTTGLGLVGTGAAAIGSYVESLAAQDVTALLLELGRTFTTPPPELVTAAETYDLPLVLLHGVVPFIEITETVHPLLISGEIDLLRRLDHATTTLHEAVAAGAGGSALTALVAELCDGPAGVYSDDGALLLGDDVRRDGAVRCEVPVGRAAWATLAVAGGRDDRRDAAVDHRLAELCARVLDLDWARSAGRAAGPAVGPTWSQRSRPGSTSPAATSSSGPVRPG